MYFPFCTIKATALTPSLPEEASSISLNISLWLSSPYLMTILINKIGKTKRKPHCFTACKLQTMCVFSWEKVSQCKGTKLAASGEVGDTGTSKAGLGICKATRLLFFERVLAWRDGELSAAWRAPQLMESSGEGSEFTAGLLSGQVWAVWGFPWGHEVDRRGGRVADSSRPLVPCVHWGDAIKRKEQERKKEKKRRAAMRRASEVNKTNSRVLNHFSESNNSCERWIKGEPGVWAGHLSDLKQQFPNVSCHRFAYSLDLGDHIW